MSDQDSAATLAQAQIEETLRLSRLDAEGAIARYRLGILLAMALVSSGMTLSGIMPSWSPALFQGTLTLVAAAILLAIRRYGAPWWLGMLALTIDIGVPVAFFTLAPADARGQTPLQFALWFSYAPTSLILFFLGVNQLRQSKVTAIYGSALAISLFLWETTTKVGWHPAQTVVCMFLALTAFVGVGAAKRARRDLVTLARLQLLRQYVPEGAVQRVLSEKVDQALAVGGRSATMTILASDLRGFTALSAELPAEEVVAQLNEFHGAMLEQVRLHGGILDKFIGDGMLAVFGHAGQDEKEAARAAVDCARAMTQSLSRLNERRGARGLAPLAIGVGVHTGPVVAGAIGAPGHRLEFTVLGDTVNTASRLETATKHLGTPVAVSGETAALLTRGSLKPLGDIELRGKPRPVAAFGLVG